jgi:hypothetical protein
VRFTCELTAPEGLSDGEMVVRGAATDELGDERSATQRVRLDRTPPQVIPVGVEHFPSLDNPRAGASPQSGSFGGTVRVLLSFDEEVTVTDTQLGPFAANAVTTDGASAIELYAELPERESDGASLLVDGALDLALTITDGVGNTDDIVINGLVSIDVTPPPPAALTEDALLLERAPWGIPEDTDTGRVMSLPRTILHVAANTASADTVALVAVEAGQRVGQAPVLADQAVDIVLVSDARSPVVLAVDDAGNLSAPRRVLLVDWIASLAGKVEGSVFENPHLAHETRSAGKLLLPIDLRETQTPGALALADNNFNTMSVRRRWRELLPYGGMHELGLAPCAFDAGRARALCVGGQGFVEPRGEHIELIDDRWRARLLDTPPAAAGASAVYQTHRLRTLLFGGDAGSGVLFGTTWEFDGAVWIERSVAGPAPRRDAAMGYDPVRGVAVLFGGRAALGGPQSTVGDTWEWDGSSWQEVLGEGPSARKEAGMAWDDVNQRMVLVGGHLEDGSFSDETWSYQLGAWQRIEVGGLGPRAQVAVAYDPQSDRILCFGGATDDSAISADFLQLNPDGWVPVDESAVLLLGGIDSTLSIGGYELTSDAWSWDGGKWHLLSEATAPHPSTQPAVVTYDPSHGSLMSHGGLLVGAAVGVTNETWLFTGAGWIDASPSPAQRGPYLPTTSAALSTGVFVVDGGAVDRWQKPIWQLGVAGVPTSAFSMGMAAEPGGTTAILLAECTTWRFAPNSWTLAAAAVVGACPSGTSLTADEGRGVVVTIDDQGTWEWDGSSWSLQQGLPTPSVGDPRLIYDADRAVVVLLEGSGFPLTYEYDGTAWTAVDASLPGPRSGAGFAYEPSLRRPMLAGGVIGGVSAGETWMLDPPDRPAQLLRFAFGAGGAAKAEFVSASLVVTGVGSGPSGDGVDVDVWSSGAFRRTAITTVGPQRHAQVPAQALSHLAVGPERSIVFRVAPSASGVSGANASQLSLDEVYASVRYRLPE